MELAKKNGIKDVELNIYQANLEKYFDVYRTQDSQVAFDAVNKILSTSYTLQELQKDDSINKHLDEDIRIAIGTKIQGMPSILFNGSYLQAREKLGQILQKNSFVLV
jgi:hypothetical protein